MAFFSRQGEETRIHYVLRLGFDRVRNDMHNIFGWITYFHQKHQQHDERLARLEQSMIYLPDQRNEVRQTIDSHYDSIQKRIEEIHARIEKLEQQKSEKVEIKAALKERLLKKVSKNSKDYVKSVILATLKKYSRISGPQLKEIIVDEQGICSKSSFYRLLGEIEQENEVGSFADGKEKTYFLKTQIVK